MEKYGIIYSYKVTDNWEGKYITEFKIKKGTAQTINDRTIRMNYGDIITNIWNAQILAYANKSADSLGALYRSDAALSSDKKTILIWKHKACTFTFDDRNPRTSCFYPGMKRRSFCLYKDSISYANCLENDKM